MHGSVWFVTPVSKVEPSPLTPPDIRRVSKEKWLDWDCKVGLFLMLI